MHDIHAHGSGGSNGANGANGADGRTPRKHGFTGINLHPDFAKAGHLSFRKPKPRPAAPVPPSPAPVVPPTPVTGQPTAPTAPTAAPDPAPAPAPAAAPAPAPAPPASPAAGLPREEEQLRESLTSSLRTIKFGLIALVVVIGAAVLLLSGHGGNVPKISLPTFSTQKTATPSSAPEQNQVSQGRTISCIGTTGTDATTDSKSFVDVEGTGCTYRTGSTPETLVLNGKLTGRNTEGTGMSVTINVNGKVCNGGETLNYSRTYTPMVSNCVFDVAANSSVAIKWQFLSPFGGNASVLRSSRNIAPSITGVSIPRTGGSGG